MMMLYAIVFVLVIALVSALIIYIFYPFKAVEPKKTAVPPAKVRAFSRPMPRVELSPQEKAQRVVKGRIEAIKTVAEEDIGIVVNIVRKWLRER